MVTVEAGLKMSGAVGWLSGKGAWLRSLTSWKAKFKPQNPQKAICRCSEWCATRIPALLRVRWSQRKQDLRVRSSSQGRNKTASTRWRVLALGRWGWRIASSGSASCASLIWDQSTWGYLTTAKRKEVKHGWLTPLIPPLGRYSLSTNREQGSAN